MTRARVRAEAEGRRAEDRAALVLRLKGWEILDQRVRTPRGEVDIVARCEGLVAFVEVKWRARREELDLAVDEYRLARVAAAAELLAPRYLQPGDDMRIDVMLVAPGRWPRHMENVWIG
jgi:putative endonuclease